ncbi:hypothetical protein [Ascidiimonas aurantiaca]|uniref:hypothetical protein n=1 Tax=Ascidiimonas aurantiaca TaxID=1685432 RepID=UPI0030ED8983
MKKKNPKKLIFNKKVISQFTSTRIKGGVNTDEVSSCLPCFEEPTEGCGDDPMLSRTCPTRIGCP